MKVDLHFHSIYSDGLYMPHQLVEMANNVGLEMIALTDHDTFEGVEEFLESAKNFNIIGIPAIEIDFIDDTFGFKSELLGYFPNGYFQNTLNYISYFQDLRKKIAELAILKAKKMFHLQDLDIMELLQNKVGKEVHTSIYEKISLTKPDIFKYFNHKKLPHLYADYQHFKTDFFNDKEFIELSAKPIFSKCIELINLDGGYAVLAHPAYQFKKDSNEILQHEADYTEMLKRAKQIGLWGIEMHSYDNMEEAIELNKIFYNFANLCGLNVTYGSDFHGKNSRNSRTIGCLNSAFGGFK